MPAHKIHGMEGTPTYNSWKSMKQRCQPSFHHSQNYYDRGIRVCERWMSFKNFLDDMGVRPEGMTLERVNNNNGYSRDNCKWATRVEQRANTRMWLGCIGGDRMRGIKSSFNRYVLRVTCLGKRVQYRADTIDELIPIRDLIDYERVFHAHLGLNNVSRG